MKKVLASLTLFMVLLAGATSASANTVLFTEDFDNTLTFSKNWDYIGGSSALTGIKVLKLTTNDTDKVFTSKQSFNFTAGNTYTMSVDAFHTLAGQTYRNITLEFFHNDAVLATVLSSVEEGVHYDYLPGNHGKSTNVELSFDALQDYDNVQMRIWLGDRNVTYGFESIVLSGGPTPPAVPIPGAAILLAPGLLGLGVMRKRMK